MIQSDQGPSFTDKFHEMCKSLGIHHRRGIVEHHQSQGSVERSHRSLQQTLAAYVDTKAKDWDELLPYALFALRTTVSSALGTLPFRLVFGGREPVLPVDNLFATSATHHILRSDFADLTEYRFYSMLSRVRENIALYTAQMKERYD